MRPGNRPRRAGRQRRGSVRPFVSLVTGESQRGCRPTPQSLRPRAGRCASAETSSSSRKIRRGCGIFHDRHARAEAAEDLGEFEPDVNCRRQRSDARAGHRDRGSRCCRAPGARESRPVSGMVARPPTLRNIFGALSRSPLTAIALSRETNAAWPRMRVEVGGVTRRSMRSDWRPRELTTSSLKRALNDFHIRSSAGPDVETP